MSEQLITCLIAVAANLVGMIVIFSLMSQAIARLAWRRRGAFAVIALIVLAQLFWIAPALWIVEARAPGHAGSYALWFGNWVACGFSLVVLWKSAAQIPAALHDTAQTDGLGSFAIWRHVVLPFIGRDLLVIAIFTVMATLLEDLLFDLPDYPEKQIVFDAEMVKHRLARIINDDDLRRYIL